MRSTEHVLFEKEKNVFDFRHKEFIERELLMPVTNIKDGNLSTELHDCKKKTTLEWSQSC